MPISQKPFQVGSFGGGDGHHNLQITTVPQSAGCSTTEVGWYVYNWDIPRGIVHEHTYRFRLRIEGRADMLVESPDVFLNATQWEKVHGKRIEMASYSDGARMVRRAVPLHRRIGLTLSDVSTGDNLLRLLMTILVLLFLATFITRKKIHGHQT